MYLHTNPQKMFIKKNLKFLKELRFGIDKITFLNGIEISAKFFTGFIALSQSLTVTGLWVFHCLDCWAVVYTAIHTNTNWWHKKGNQYELSNEGK